MTHRKLARNARDKLKDPSGSQTNESSQLPYDKTLLRAGEIDRVAMKRKEPHFQIEKSPKDVTRLALSYQKKTTDGRSKNGNGAHAKARKNNQSTFGNQKKVLGQNKDKGMFVFGSSAGLSKVVGLNQNQRPFSPSQIKAPYVRPGTTDKEGISYSLCLSNYGKNREVGIVLQKQNHSNRGRDNQMDPTRANGDLGVVRLGADAWLPSFDEQGMGVDSKSVVEICHGYASVPSPATIKAKLASDKNKHANLRKIADRDRKGMDGNRDLSEEDPSRLACGMLYEREFTQGEDDSVCRSQDQRNHSHQDFNRGDGYCSPLNHPVSQEFGEEGRGDGRMDIERH